jgi:glutaredoxin 3
MQLELYVREDCPFSAKVRKYLGEKHLESKVNLHDIDSDEESLRELMSINYDEQVPCLVVDGKPMLESDQIIEWFDKNIAQIQ